MKEESRDFVDQASMGSDTDFTFRLRERESRLILKVIEALERLDQGVFGICEECDREISVERLKARPIATLCIECKRAQEASEKVRGAQLPSYE
ncbi:MAG: TraR/DksA C4-type zinc finger protein [Desulfobacteraceae bacterium]|nr:TraR/DksA C4-type zinc finger protein [Desulfobacteraceae bacterium]